MAKKTNKTNPLKLEFGLRLLAKSSVIVFVGVMLSKIFSYLYKIVIARYYGPETYGLFSLGIMILGWFLAIFSLGLAEGIVRFVPLYRGEGNYEKIKHILRVSAKFTLICGLVASMMLFLLAEPISMGVFNNANLALFLKIFSFVIPMALLSRLFLSLLRGFEKISAYSFILNILQNGVILLALVLFLLMGLKKISSIPLSYLAGFLAAFIISFLFCKYSLHDIFGKPSLKDKIKNQVAKKLFSYSWPLMFLGIITTIFYWIDSFVLGYFKGAEFVGFYNAVVPIVALLGIFPDLFMQLFFPLITKEYAKRNSKIIVQLSKQVAKWIFLLDLPLALALFIFPGAAINILFGPQYLAAETALRILVVGGLVSSVLIGLSSTLLSMIGKSRLMLANILAMTLLNIILNVLLVPRYGINGAAIASATSWVLLSLILLVETRICINFIPLKKSFSKIFLVSLIPAVLLVYAKQFFQINLFSLILLVSFFLLSYLLLIFLAGCLDEQDTLLLKVMFQKILPKASFRNKLLNAATSSIKT